MRDGWRTCRIGELADVSRGSSPRPIHDERYFEGGSIPWVKIADATASGKRLYKTKTYLNEFGASFSKVLPVGTILVAASGTLGYTQVLGVPACAHDGWLILQNLRGLDPDFAYYALRTLEQSFYNAAYGAAIQNINTDILRNVELQVPPLPVQIRIGQVLSAYDDLIEVNQRRIGVLEETTRRVFEEWFIRLRVPGQRSRGTSGLPDGWRMLKLCDWADEVRDSVLPSALEAACRYVGLEHLPRRSTTLLDVGRADAVISTKLRFKPGDVLFGKIRPYFHKVAYAPWDGVTSSDTIVIRAKHDAWRAVVLALASSDPFVAYAVTTSNGTKMPRAAWNVLKQYPLPQPPIEVIERFNKVAIENLKMCTNLAEQNARLASARDLLAPQLVRGDIEAADRDALAMEAA